MHVPCSIAPRGKGGARHGGPMIERERDEERIYSLSFEGGGAADSFAGRCKRIG